MKRYVKSTDDYLDAIFSADPDMRMRTARFTEDPELLEIYLNDPDQLVREIALRRCKDPEILRKLASSQNDKTVLYVAENENTPPDVLEDLANHSSVYVRLAVARNIMTPYDALLGLQDDEDEDIVYQASRTLGYKDLQNQQ